MYFQGMYFQGGDESTRAFNTGGVKLMCQQPAPSPYRGEADDFELGTPQREENRPRVICSSAVRGEKKDSSNAKANASCRRRVGPQNFDAKEKSGQKVRVVGSHEKSSLFANAGTSLLEVC